MITPIVLKFATRPSSLARWQTNWVIQQLKDARPAVEYQEVVITTQGDRLLDHPLPEIGGKGVFTQELEMALTSRQVDAAVHSLKDLPVEHPDDLTIGAVPLRGEVRDVLVSASGYTLRSLPEGAYVGTSSPRRASQLLAYRPDLNVQPLRGNVDTRIRKALEGQYDAIVLAGAGVTRLNLLQYVSDWLPLEIMLPAPGQGALAVQCRAGDEQILDLLESLEHSSTRAATRAERAFLSGLGGGCSLPVAAYAQVAKGVIELEGMIASPDGRRLTRFHVQGYDPVEVGFQMAQQAILEGAKEYLF